MNCEFYALLRLLGTTFRFKTCIISCFLHHVLPKIFPKQNRNVKPLRTDVMWSLSLSLVTKCLSTVIYSLDLILSFLFSILTVFHFMYKVSRKQGLYPPDWRWKSSCLLSYDEYRGMRKWRVDNGHEDWRPQGIKQIHRKAFYRNAIWWPCYTCFNLVKMCFYGMIARNHEVGKSDENMIRTFIEWEIKGDHVVTKNKREETKLMRDKTAKKKWPRELLGWSLAHDFTRPIFLPGSRLTDKG